MKNILCFLFTLLIFINVSYASFPINVNSSIDTLQTDQIIQYHSSLLKMGIDLKTCKCESCRSGIAPLIVVDNEYKEVSQRKRVSIVVKLLIVLAILGALFMLLLFRWAENFNKSNGIGVG